MVTGIPEIIHDFNIYHTGSKILGITGEVTLPDLEPITEKISGAGLLGEIEVAAAGHYGSIEQTIPFRCFNGDYFRLINPSSPVDLTIRGAAQVTEPDTGKTKYVQVRVAFRGKCKKISLGTIKQAGPMDSSITIELSYLLIEIDGEEKFKLDKINNVFAVNGVDCLADVHRLT